MLCKRFGLHHAAVAAGVVVLASLLGVEPVEAAFYVFSFYCGWELANIWDNPNRFHPVNLQKHFFDVFSPAVAAFLTGALL